MATSHAKQSSRKRERPKRVQVTLGELVAAAFDALGDEARAVKRVLSSETMAKASGRRIVFV